MTNGCKKRLSISKARDWRLHQRAKVPLSYCKFQLEKFGILSPGEMEAAQLHWRGKFQSYVFQEQIF
jgi:hypothetical protein